MRCIPLLNVPHLALLLGACLALGAATAAPTTTEETAASQQDDTQPVNRAVRPGASPGESRAVDLLIQMQTRSAGLEFNERKPLTDSREMRLRPLPAAEAKAAPPDGTAPTNASGLFGSGATPAVQTTRVSQGESRMDGAASPSGTGRTSSAASSNGEPPLWMLLPREVIEYVRENRGFVLGSVSALLLVIWGLSLAFSRRRA